MRRDTRKIKKRSQCKHCGDEFEVANYNQKFCNGECRIDYHNGVISEAMAMYRAKHEAEKAIES